MSRDGLDSLQKSLQHTFAKPELLERALTHRSFSADHYERLEFLGDSVLGLVMSDMLYQQLKQLPEGDLSRVRANLVREETLHKLAVGLELSSLLRLGEGEMRSGGARRASILADALEAIIGAVYLDAGFDAAHALVKRLFAKVEFTSSMSAREKDPKTALQEWLQARKHRLPIYTIVATTGLAHQQNFDVECAIPDLNITERGLGASRRAAEQAAAAAMLQTIQTRNKK